MDPQSLSLWLFGEICSHQSLFMLWSVPLLAGLLSMLDNIPGFKKAAPWLFHILDGVSIAQLDVVVKAFMATPPPPTKGP